jgi:hypothetical protein
VKKKSKPLSEFTSKELPPTSKDFRSVLSFFNEQVVVFLPLTHPFKMQGSSYTVTRIVECYNPGLLKAFMDKRVRLLEQQKTAPELFKNQQWRLEDDADERTKVYNRFQQRVLSKFY